jgi:hypothetical protein
MATVLVQMHFTGAYQAGIKVRRPESDPNTFTDFTAALLTLARWSPFSLPHWSRFSLPSFSLPSPEVGFVLYTSFPRAAPFRWTTLLWNRLKEGSREEKFDEVEIDQSPSHGRTRDDRSRETQAAVRDGFEPREK